MSEVKVNKISPRSGTTVTLGDSGDTFTIPSGATINNQGTATNFGATGSASWTTTVKTSGFTAVAGEGYFVDTTSGAISVNLPAGTAGAVVAFKDYLGTFDTNAVTLVQNGSDKIGGSTVNATLNTEGIAVTLVFIDSTQGWLVTDSGLQDEAPTGQYVAATGGSVATSGNFKVHTFTGPGTFCVSAAGNAAGSNQVDYLIVAGGGGGANNTSGGGGAGGYRETPGTISSYTASPIAGSVAALTVAVQAYPVTVGAGGAGKSNPGRGDAGSVSTFNSQSSAGGGGGHAGNNAGEAGGSGSGGAGGTPPGIGNPYPGGAGNTPPVSPSQGNNGGGGYDGIVTNTQGGGGGGAGAAGSIAAAATGGNGGNGTASEITASSVTRAGGGGGGSDNSGNPGGTAGTGGSGGGGNASTYGGGNASDGTANTGGGGGGAAGPGASSAGGSGGSGIVIIRYKFQ